METLSLHAASAANVRPRAARPPTVVRLRELRPGDVPAVRRFLERVAPEDLRSRFHATVSRHSERLAAELARHDGRSRLALAVVFGRPGGDEVLAVLNVACAAGRGEWAVLVRSDLKGRGLGTFLLDELLRRAARLGITELQAEAFADNHRVIALARRFGHVLRPAAEGTVALVRTLESDADAGELDDDGDAVTLAATAARAADRPALQ